MLPGIVETFWHHDGTSVSRHRERVLPNGRFQVVINLESGRGVVSGLLSKSVEVETSSIPAAVGAVLCPGAACAFFAPPADAFADTSVSLEDVWGSWVRSFIAQLQECARAEDRLALVRTMFTEAVTRAAKPPLHPAVRYALATFSAHIGDVRSAAKGCGLSRRRLTQLFREQVGMPPKLFVRLLRFRKFVDAVRTRRDIASVAIEAGYYDQSHLARDFHDFAGMTPGSFVAAEKPSLNHIRLD